MTVCDTRDNKIRLGELAATKVIHILLSKTLQKHNMLKTEATNNSNDTQTLVKYYNDNHCGNKPKNCS